MRATATGKLRRAGTRRTYASLWLAGWLAGAGAAGAATIYVSLDGTNDAANRYDTWAGAATNIHDAVAIATNGEVVLVTNGAYAVTGTVQVAGAYAVASVNGPDATTIYRASTAGSMGVLAVSNANALVSGFSITNGMYSGYSGVGARLYSGVISNCVFTRNQSGVIGTTTLHIFGGLVSDCIISNNAHYSGPVNMTGGTLEDSVITASTAVDWGGIRISGASTLVRRCVLHNLNVDYSTDPIVILAAGAMENCLIHDCTSLGSAGRAVNMSGGRLVNCTITRNTSFSSPVAGVFRSGGVITNCVIYGNGKNTAAANYQGTVAGVVYNSCSPAFTAGEQGNIVDDPQFVDLAGGDFRLRLGSPARDTGTNLASVVEDLDGAPRPLESGAGLGARHDMGAYEMDGTTGPFAVGFHGVAPLAGLASLTVTFRANAAGADRTVTWYGWDFDNDGTYETSGPGLGVVTNTFGPGLYSVALLASNTLGAAAAATNLDYVSVVPLDLYVATNGLDVFPYANWADAATSVHDALSAAVGGCTVHIGDGDFAATNQILLAEGVRVLGNGPGATTVGRNAAAGNFNVFFLDHADAFVAGLAVTNGYGTSAEAAAFKVNSGMVSNCLVTRNNSGAGFWNPVTIAAGAQMTHCAISNNATYSGGVVVSSGGVIEDSLVMECSGVDRGGMYLAGTGRRLRIVGNRAHGAYGPGGVQLAGRLENSLVSSNDFTQSFLSFAPGVYMSGGSMVNCTVAGNIAAAASAKGSGVQRTGGVITNAMMYGNSGSGGTNYVGDVSAVWYSCAPDLTHGDQGNITNAPQFEEIDGDLYRLAAHSPGVNAGLNLPGMQTAVDLAGKPRIGEGVVDMGAYERPALAATLILLR